MIDTIHVLTSRDLPRLLDDGGSGNWKLDPTRARHCRYLVCSWNRLGEYARLANDLDHKEGFLVATIAGIVPSNEPGRRLIQFDTYAEIRTPNLWPGLRNPVTYTSLDALNIDPEILAFTSISLEATVLWLPSSPSMEPDDAVPAVTIGADLAQRLNCCSSLARVVGVRALQWKPEGSSSADHVLDAQDQPLRITRIAAGIEKLCSYCGDRGLFILADDDGRVEVACELHVRPVQHYLSAGAYVLRAEPFQQWIAHPAELTGYALPGIDETHENLPRSRARRRMDEAGRRQSGTRVAMRRDRPLHLEVGSTSATNSAPHQEGNDVSALADQRTAINEKQMAQFAVEVGPDNPSGRALMLQVLGEIEGGTCDLVVDAAIGTDRTLPAVNAFLSLWHMLLEGEVAYAQVEIDAVAPPDVDSAYHLLDGRTVLHAQSGAPLTFTYECSAIKHRSWFGTLPLLQAAGQNGVQARFPKRRCS